MLKSARYFFLIFIITTVIPLFLMFSWTNKRIDSMMSAHSKAFSDVGKREFSVALNGYIERQEGKFLVNIRDVDLQKAPLSVLQKRLSPAQVAIVRGHNLKKITSYYELKNDGKAKSLFSIVIIPFENSKNKGLKISQKVDFTQFPKFGPFRIEVYEGSKICKQNFLGKVHSLPMPHPGGFPGDFPPPPAEGFLKNSTPPPFPHPEGFSGDFPPPPSFEHHNEPPIYQSKDSSYATLPVLGRDGAIIVIFAIAHHKMFKPMEARLFENNLGLMILILGSVLSLLMAFYIQRTFMEPLKTLSGASRRLQEGDFDINLKTEVRNQEIRHTFQSFNQMCRELKEKEELRKSFIVNLTHDLRTPLIAQERSLSMIAKCFEKLKLVDEFDLSKSLEKNNQHLLRMVNLILESYRFDAKDINLVYSDINLSAVVDSSYEKIQSLALDKEIQLENNVSPQVPIFRADEISLKRILVNLVSNSIENLSYGGFVKVSAVQDEDFVIITVEDNGCGMAPDDINHIFDRYYSGKSLERKLGSGLGLDVCKKLVELHKGTIFVESEVNLFTKFTVKFPIKEQIWR